MRQRFTKTARWVVDDAVRAAERRGDPVVGTEHLLLGIAAMPVHGINELGVTRERVREALDRLDAEALRAIGIDIDPAHTPIGPVETCAPRGRRHLPFTQDAKDVLEGALREAGALSNRHLGPEHIALALTRVSGDAPAARLLHRLGIDPVVLREHLLERLDHAA